MIEKGKNWICSVVNSGDTKKMMELRDLCSQRGVKMRMLELQIESVKKDHDEEKKRMMKMLEEERENRMSLVRREVESRNDLNMTSRQIDAVVREFTKFKVVVSRTGEAHQDVKCRYVPPAHSHSGVPHRACTECMPKALRSVLESLGKSYSCGHTGT